MNKTELKNQLRNMGIEIKGGMVKKSDIKAAIEKVKKEVNLSELITKIKELYRDQPSKRPQILKLFTEMADTLGVEIPIKDDRDGYLIADENGKLVKSFWGYRDAAKFIEENPQYKSYNRTHPKCPPELVKEFDELTGW
jgi:hypothetical protein